MTDENVVDFVNGDVETSQLHLRALTTVDQKMPVVNDHIVR